MNSKPYIHFMKKLFILLFACLFIVACGGKKNEVAKDDTPKNTVLILYYSQTGATASVANQLKSFMEADIEEIICENPYSGDFETTIERCKKEREKGEIPAIKPIKSNVQKYDIIFLGYPIWFGTYAPPIASLIENAHFEGKMIVPFCTFGSGGLESSVEELEDFLVRNGYMQGEAEDLTDFKVQEELSEADKKVFHEACDSYPYPMGTPTSVSKRYRKNGTEYRFTTRGSDDVNSRMTVYIKLRNEKNAKAEFTKVVR